MAINLSRQGRRLRRGSDKALHEVAEFIDENPMTASAIALGAGALATMLFKAAAGMVPQGQKAPAAATAAPAAAAPKKAAAAPKKKPVRKRAAKKRPAASRAAGSARKK